MSLFNRKNLDKNNKTSNPYGITEDDMIGQLKDFPVGVVVKMMEEQEKQGNEPDVTVFQKDFTSDVDENGGGFDWDKSIEGFNFWDDAIGACDFDLFFEKYPEYEKYN